MSAHCCAHNVFPFFGRAGVAQSPKVLLIIRPPAALSALRLLASYTVSTHHPRARSWFGLLTFMARVAAAVASGAALEPDRLAQAVGGGPGVRAARAAAGGLLLGRAWPRWPLRRTRWPRRPLQRVKLHGQEGDLLLCRLQLLE